MLVEQALDAIELHRIEQANLASITPSLIGQYIARSKGAKNVQDHAFNPFGQYLYTKEAKDTIDPQAAKTFLSLTASNRVPSWVIAQLDIKLIRTAASEKQ